MPYRSERGLGETFVVNMNYKKNHTWQGNVRWIEGQKEISFQSALELIKMLDSSIRIPEEKNFCENNGICDVCVTSGS